MTISAVVSTASLPCSSCDAKAKAKGELTESEQKKVDQLKQIDQTVHSNATSKGEDISNSQSFQFETGPDGKQYAIGVVKDSSPSVASDNSKTTGISLQDSLRKAEGLSNSSVGQHAQNNHDEDNKKTVASTQNDAAANNTQQSHIAQQLAAEQYKRTEAIIGQYHSVGSHGTAGSVSFYA